MSFFDIFKKKVKNDGWNYPKLIGELSPAEKKKKAEELFRDFGRTYFPQSLKSVCQDDYKTLSLLTYRLVAEVYSSAPPVIDRYRICRFLDIGPDGNCPITKPLYVPVRYCGGNMSFGHVFSINICAFSSDDSIIGFRNSEYHLPQEYFKIIKGLRFVGTHENWTLFKLDVASTDDMTAMLYSALEKNFTIEFAHFPHEGGHRILFRWVDS